MSKTQVLRDFNTSSRRFKAGAAVTRDDLAGDVMTADDRVSRGFLAAFTLPKPAFTPSPPPAAGDAPPATAAGGRSPRPRT